MAAVEVHVIPELKNPELQTIESRIVELLQQDRYRWQELAQLALLVRRERLYLKRGMRSFTAWIKGIAEASGRQPSLFWRYLKAAVYYLRQVESEDIERIGEIKAAPEALDRLEKIERQAPRPVFEAMREKVMAGEATVLECRQVERQYRPENALSNRGRPIKGAEGDYAYLGQWRSAKERETLKAEAESLSREQVTQLLQHAVEAYVLTWSRDCAGASYVARNHAFYTNLKIPQGNQLQILESIAVVRWDLAQPKAVFAVATKNCLATFEQQQDWTIYLNLCHYFSLAIPKQDIALQQAIRQQTPSHVGILLVDLNTTPSEATGELSYVVEVARKPKRTDANAVGVVYEALYDEVMAWKR